MQASIVVPQNHPQHSTEGNPSIRLLSEGSFRYATRLPMCVSERRAMSCGERDVCRLSRRASARVEVLCTNEDTLSTVHGLGRSLGCVDRANSRARPCRTELQCGCGPVECIGVLVVVACDALRVKAAHCTLREVVKGAYDLRGRVAKPEHVLW